MRSFVNIRSTTKRERRSAAGLTTGSPTRPIAVWREAAHGAVVATLVSVIH